MIKIDIKDSELVEAPSSMAETIVISRLNSAGVPVKGVLRFCGVSSGTIRTFREPTSDGIQTFVWEPYSSKYKGKT